MKARILDQQAAVYSEPDDSSPWVTQLYAGMEVDITGVKKKGGKQWAKVKLATGQEGYLRGDSKVFFIKLVNLLQNSAKYYSEPSLTSLPRGEFKKNDKFYLMDVVNSEGRDWVKVRDASGREGFIEGNTKIKEIPQINKEIGKRNMRIGATWFAIGVAVTVFTYSAASSGGTYIIAWGAVLFGAIQFLQGLYQYLTSNE